MKTLQGYFLRETVRPLLLAITVLGALALLTQSLAALDLVVNDRASLAAYLKITLLALPQLLAIILPFAVFIAVAHAVSRLHSDNEVMVAFAGGMTRWAVIDPVLRLACLAALVNLAVGVWLQPYAYKAMRKTIHDVRSDLAAALIHPGAFTTPALNLTFFARDVKNGVLDDVMIHDGRNAQKPVTYFAKSGAFIDTGSNPALLLINATRQNVTADGTLEVLQFSRTSVELRGVIEPQGALFYKPSDRFLGELFHPDPANYWDQQNAGALKAEGHFRLSLPLYDIAFALMALAALLGGEYSRMGYTRRLLAAGALALLLRLLGFAISALAADRPTLNLVQYALPLSAAALSLWLILHQHRRASRVKTSMAVP